MTRIAIIEEVDAMHAKLVETIDDLPGYRCVCECSTSKQALMEIPRLQPDVVLMDVQLSDGSGIDCMARLIEKMPDLQIIIVSLSREIDLILKALRAGASGYILKRFRPEEIVQAIDEVQTGGAPLSSEIAKIVVRSFRQPIAVSEVDGLTARENEMLKLLADGFTNKEIAQKTNISAGTVRNHLEHIFRKLDVRCRTEAAAKFLRKKSV